MSTATKTVTLNAAFLQEIKEDHLELWQMLDNLEQTCSSERWQHLPRRHLANHLADLRDRLAMHYALEEAFGYFEDAVETAPRLSKSAEELRQQHTQLYQRICEICDHAEEVVRHRGRLTEGARLAENFVEFCQRVREHESAENRLISGAFNDDIGVGD